MDNKINFTGSFVIKKPGRVKWKEIVRDMLPENSYIKGNFLGQGNMFVATSDRYDNEVVTYLINHNYVFSYYPKVNKKSGICNMPQSMIEELVEGSEALTKRKAIVKAATEAENRYIPDSYVRKPDDQIPQTMNALRTVEHIPVDSLKPLTINGETLFVDSKGKLVAKASPNNPRGFNFIQIYPRYTTSEDMEMIKADYTGSINYRTKNIDKLRLFKRDFMAAVNSVNQTRNRG